MSEFLSAIFQFLEVKFSIYLNRHVFIICINFDILSVIVSNWTSFLFTLQPMYLSEILILVLLTQIYPVFINGVDPDQLALYQQLGSSNLIGWKLGVGVAS